MSVDLNLSHAARDHRYGRAVRRLNVKAAAATMLVAFGCLAALAGAAADDTVLVSRADGAGSPQGNSASTDGAISADGRIVAFVSTSTDLAAPDNSTDPDVFVRDVAAGTTRLVSRAAGPSGAKANSGSAAPAVSGDGRYVAFHSDANNLHPDESASAFLEDVYRRDLTDGSMALVSRASGASGTLGDGRATAASISADGSRIAFASTSTNLDAADTDATADIFVRDLVANTTTLVSRATGVAGAKGGGASRAPSISADGRWVSFESDATNLDPADGDATSDVFVRDLQAATTTLVSRATGAAGAKGNGASSAASDLRRRARGELRVDASNLDPDDAGAGADVFVRDVQAGTTALVSRSGGSTGAKGNGASSSPSISGDGRLVAFASLSSNLHPDDFNGESGIFVRDLVAGTTALASRASGIAGTSGWPSTAPAMATGGAFVAFDSGSGSLVGDTPVVNQSGVFRKELGAATPAANDDFIDAAVLSGASATASALNLAAGEEAGEPIHGGIGAGASLWWRWTAPASGTVTVDTCGSTFDTVLAVYRDATSLATLTNLASSDDACGTASRVSFLATAGQVYAIAVDAFSGLRGTVALHLGSPAAPPNDDFASATALSGAAVTTSGPNVGASLQAGEPVHGLLAGASVWWRWTAPGTGNATIDLCDSSFDTQLAVYTGTSVAALTRVAADDDACLAGSRVSFPAQAGVSYAIAVSGFDSETGDIVLKLAGSAARRRRRPCRRHHHRRHRPSRAARCAAP